jgi:hypothetical protein
LEDGKKVNGLEERERERVRRTTDIERDREKYATVD